MKRFTVGVYPTLEHKGLKMSRDVTVEAENQHFAKEMVQSWYPDARIIVKGEQAIDQTSEFSSRSSRSSSDGDLFILAAAYIGVFIGQIFRLVFRLLTWLIRLIFFRKL